LKSGLVSLEVGFTVTTPEEKVFGYVSEFCPNKRLTESPEGFKTKSKRKVIGFSGLPKS